MTGTVLVTGFEPFDGFEVNPSAEVARSLDGEVVATYDVIGRVLPLDYRSLGETLERLVTEHRPDVVLACGQANRGAITLERIAINAVSTTREDNTGYAPERDLIIEYGPAAYFTTIDVHRLAEVLRTHGIPAEVSYHAGTYGCNWVLYFLLHRAAMDEQPERIGFVHIPPLPSQAIQKRLATLPTMGLTTSIQAIRLIITHLD
ncbi:MAG: pyroglutamyl-peptidase I family protein [Candidatus Thorarchaeota archaeon]